MSANASSDPSAAVNDYIMHHVTNGQVWHTPLFHFDLPAPLSLHAVMLIVCSVFLLILFGVLYDKKSEVPTGLTNFLELFVVFIRDEICIPSLGQTDGRKMTPLFCTFFFFILGLNLIGLIPLFATATGNINVTGALAIIVFGFMTLGAIIKNGPGKFIGAFIPHGVPIPVLILLVPIEMAGVLIKCFALMIRLFANMLAGHIVIYSLLSLIVVVGSLAIVPAVLLGLAISVLEILVAFLQAYIFTLLSAMFVGMIYHPAH